jgi:hypothetical protein
VCEVINNTLVEYEKTRNILHRKNNDNLLEDRSHKADEIGSRDSEATETHKEAKLCLTACCNRTRANDTKQEQEIRQLQLEPETK